MQTRLHYDALAEAYMKNRAVHPGVLGSLIRQADTEAMLDLLEVGCGTGNYVGKLHELTAWRCSGIDPSYEMLTHAHVRFGDISLWQAQAEQLPFADRQFDFIFSVDVIHHIRDREAYFHESYRVLRPGGRICTVTDSESVIRRRRPLSSHFPETVPVELARYPAIEQLRTEISQAGFFDQTEEEVEFHYHLTDIRSYREKSYSSLHLIDQSAFEQGIGRLEHDLMQGPVACSSFYTLLWATRP